MAEYIERDALLQMVKPDDPVDEVNAITIATGKYLIRKFVSDAPAADVAPVRHGRWLPQVVLGQKAWDCSECKTLGSPHWKWCPVCGAMMHGGSD